MPIPIPSIWAQLSQDGQRGSFYPKAAKAIYDFSEDGGAIGLITPKNNAILPAKAIVMGGVIDVITTPVGATATIAIGTSAGSSASSIKAALAVASYTGLVAVIPVFTVATSFKMTADGLITLTVATAALTAGRIGINIFYILGD